MDEHLIRLAAAESTIAELRRELTELRAQLTDVRGRMHLTMRGQSRCPGCGGRALLHATQVLDRGESNSRMPMAIVRPKWWSGKVVGQFEIYACIACGLVEWYAGDLDKIEVDGKVFRRIEEHVDPGGPFR
jgi:hypothetical protein